MLLLKNTSMSKNIKSLKKKTPRRLSVVKREAYGGMLINNITLKFDMSITFFLFQKENPRNLSVDKREAYEGMLMCVL